LQEVELQNGERDAGKRVFFPIKVLNCLICEDKKSTSFAFLSISLGKVR